MREWSAEHVSRGIVDLGCGSGRFLELFIKEVDWQIDYLALVDLDSSLVDQAMARFRRYNSVDGVCTDFRDLDGLDKVLERTDLVIGVCSFHHLHWDDKTRFFSEILARGQRVLVGELDGDHDVYEQGHPNLVASCERFYSGLRNAIRFESSFETINRGLLIPEERSILENDLKERGEYHLSLRNWIELLRASGARTILNSRRTLSLGAPDSLALLAC
ncbi:class I SAM-dependent methyltransferase [bacterium]|nr:class I SAM-dependent methyltransferase [bacterium]